MSQAMLVLCCTSVVILEFKPISIMIIYSWDLWSTSDSEHDAESDKKSWGICLLQMPGKPSLKTDIRV